MRNIILVQQHILQRYASLLIVIRNLNNFASSVVSRVLFLPGRSLPTGMDNRVVRKDSPDAHVPIAADASGCCT